MRIGNLLCIQTGTNNVQLVNQSGNLGFIPTFRIDAGDGAFSIISDGKFTVGKTSVFCSGSIVPYHEISVDGESNAPNEINFVNSNSGVPANGIGQFSFLIIIDDECEYTPDELSKLAHAKSILFGSGSEKLIQIAQSL